MTSNRSLRELLLEHNNDYGFVAVEALQPRPSTLRGLSVVIPYWETGPLLLLTLMHLYDAIADTKALYPDWEFEVVVLDDGSQTRQASHVISVSAWEHLRIATSPQNHGRSRTRNEGLHVSRHDLCLFLDSDVAIDASLLLNGLTLAERCHRRGHSCIVVALFETRLAAPPLGRLEPLDIRLNDFRHRCLYRADWIGCQDDLRFVSTEFHLLRQTKHFRDWKGMIGPWCLANMVLGGFFVVDRKHALAVNGFDDMFQRYGFTETTLPTKLIAELGAFVIPIPVGGAIHSEINPAHHTSAERTSHFRQAHARYFGDYLPLGLSEAAHRSGSRWQS